MYLPYAGDYMHIHAVNTAIAKRIVKIVRNSAIQMRSWARAAATNVRSLRSLRRWSQA